MNHHAVLGLQKGAGVAEIKKAYRKRIKECHPDRHGKTPENEARFNQLTTAYDALLNPTTTINDASDDMTYVDVTLTITLDHVYSGYFGLIAHRPVLIPPGCVEGYVVKYKIGDTKTLRVTTTLRPYPGYTVMGHDLHTDVFVRRRHVRRGKPIRLTNHPSWLSTLMSPKIELPLDIQEGEVSISRNLGLPTDTGGKGNLYVTTHFKNEWYFIKQFFRETPNWVFAAIAVLIAAILNLFI